MQKIWVFIHSELIIACSVRFFLLDVRHERLCKKLKVQLKMFTQCSNIYLMLVISDPIFQPRSPPSCTMTDGDIASEQHAGSKQRSLKSYRNVLKMTRKKQNCNSQVVTLEVWKWNSQSIWQRINVITSLNALIIHYGNYDETINIAGTKWTVNQFKDSTFDMWKLKFSYKIFTFL